MKQYWPGGRSVESLVADVEQAVRSGSLTDGSLLPPVRELANRLDLSATTVANAYRTLRLRGIARGEGRRGTFINALSSVGDVDVEVPDGTRNLARGNPDPALLPDLRSHLMKAIPNSPDLYGSDLIDDNLAQACREMFVSDGVPNGKLILCNGALDGIGKASAGSHRRFWNDARRTCRSPKEQQCSSGHRNTARAQSDWSCIQ